MQIHQEWQRALLIFEDIHGNLKLDLVAYNATISACEKGLWVAMVWCFCGESSHSDALGQAVGGKKHLACCRPFSWSTLAKMGVDCNTASMSTLEHYFTWCHGSAI